MRIRAIALLGLLAGCGSSHCPTPAPDPDGGSERLDSGLDSGPACPTVSPAFVGPILSLQPDGQWTGCSTRPGTPLRIFLFDADLRPFRVMTASCTDTDYVSLGELPVGRYWLAVEADVMSAGRGLIRPDVCVGDYADSAWCSPLEFEVPPCAMGLAAVSLLCDSTLADDCGGGG